MEQGRKGAWKRGDGKGRKEEKDKGRNGEKIKKGNRRGGLSNSSLLTLSCPVFGFPTIF